MPAPNMQISQLPASNVDEEQKFLQQQYDVQARALEQTPMTGVQFKTKILQLQTKTTMEWNKITQGRRQKAAEREQVQRLIGQGTAGQTRQQEADMRMQLGPEAERLVYPTEKQPSTTPFSQGILRSKAFRGAIIDFADAAVDKRGFEWGPPEKTRQSLLQQYMRWRDEIGYDYIDNPVRQHQMDLQWDSLMRDEDDVFKEWWADKKKRKPIAEVMSLRSTGKLSKSISKRLVDSALTSEISASPIGNSMQRKKKKVDFSAAASGYWQERSKDTEPTPTAEQLKRVNTREAYEEGVKLGYWQ